MKIILFTHPNFLGSNSMPRFARMIEDFLAKESIECVTWTAKPFFYKLSPKSRFSKWLGYIDQYIVFPLNIRLRLIKESKDTLFVFCDQALGPWVPLVAKRPHVIHCHDFMALRSALGLHSENPTSFTGRLYQKYIQRGFKQGKNFISISNRTRDDLHKYSKIKAQKSEVVYNGLNYPYKPQAREKALNSIISAGVLSDDSGCLLHVGAGQWYKNTIGIIKMYSEYCNKVIVAKPLILVSPSPKGSLLQEVNKIPANGYVKFVQGLDISVLEALYSYADVFLFPSLAEGFGWPIIEAQACGCPVITTDDTPMNEIGGPVAIYLKQHSESNQQEWLEEGANHLVELIELSFADKQHNSSKAITWAQNFDAKKTLASYLKIYISVAA
jgi:glycosyltransferase involved in cell wall biosynthesis